MFWIFQKPYELDTFFFRFIESCLRMNRRKWIFVLWGKSEGGGKRNGDIEKLSDQYMKKRMFREDKKKRLKPEMITWLND